MLTDEKALREKLDAMVKALFPYFHEVSSDVRKLRMMDKVAIDLLDENQTLLREKEQRETPCLWIPCSERMPELERPVLAGYWATRVTPEGRFPEFQFSVGVLDYEDMEDNMEWDESTTHWMPLPDPPVQVKQKEEE